MLGCNSFPLLKPSPWRTWGLVLYTHSFKDNFHLFYLRFSYLEWTRRGIRFFFLGVFKDLHFDSSSFLAVQNWKRVSKRIKFQEIMWIGKFFGSKRREIKKKVFEDFELFPNSISVFLSFTRNFQKWLSIWGFHEEVYFSRQLLLNSLSRLPGNHKCLWLFEIVKINFKLIFNVYKLFFFLKTFTLLAKKKT